MEWLRLLLTAAIEGDKELDIDAVMEQIESESEKHVIAKTDYDNINAQLEAANGTIDTLKKDNTDNEALQAKITAHEQTISGLSEENVRIRQEYALKADLQKQGVIDPDYLIFKHGGIEKFNFDKENKPVGVENVTKSYKESIPHIFANDKPAATPQIRGAAPAGSADPDDGTPSEPKSLSEALRDKYRKED